MRSTRHGNPFSFCQTWGQAVFFRSEAGSSYLSQYGENGGGPGGRIRANPRRILKINPSSTTEEVDDFRCERCARVDHQIVPLKRGMTHCPECHEPIEWPENQENVDPDIGM